MFVLTLADGLCCARLYISFPELFAGAWRLRLLPMNGLSRPLS
jgi:hypothetical protein